MPDEFGPIEIGPKEIYREVVSLRSDFGHLSTELVRMADADAETRRRLTDHETRLRDLERRVWALPTAATIIAAGALAVAIVNGLVG